MYLSLFLQTSEQQNELFKYGAIQCITELLSSNAYKVQIPTLNWLAQMCYQNESISAIVVSRKS